MHLTMRTFLFFIVLLFTTTSTEVVVIATTATTTEQQLQNHQLPLSPPPETPPHGHHRRNTAKFFGYVRINETSYLHNQTELQNEFIHAHNWVRSEYNLPAFTWDETLASFARQYLMERYQDCKLVHSSASYGENMFWGKRLHWTPSDAVYYWYTEKNWYDFNTLKCASPPRACEHFTQIVWRDSTRVGCALKHCQNPDTGMLIACEYDPPGNYVDENPLQVHLSESS